VEWVESVLVDRVPAAGRSPTDAGLVGARRRRRVMAAQMRQARGACDFFTALGDDEHGARAVERFAELGITADVEWFGRRDARSSQVDAHGERTITTVGRSSAAATSADGRYDAVFFVAGEPRRCAPPRRALPRATPRELPTLLEGDVHLDLLVGSGTDPGERYDGGLDVALV
jgi:sugar/nucleoside kinase (ribokinase family)